MAVSSLLTDGATGTTQERPARARDGAGSSRRDIQGLRAFAVMAVVLDHLLGWPRSGFVGVDVFFVISGFLITGILLREHERTGRISFRGFYRRRVKRIVPAATAVIAFTVAGSWFAFNASRFSTTVTDALYALGFAGNWRFALQSTDYFSQGRPVSPLQQFWSLGVEEQFYFVWPALLLLVFTLVGRRSARSARLVVGGALAVLTVASFAWALWETAAVPDRAYFSTFSRTWELGIGAMLAVAAPQLGRLPAAARPVLSWVGLVGMTASLWLVTPDVAFPAPWAALPVLATALVIAAGTGVPQQRLLAPLTNRVSQYVGTISYSLYLWHFPIIILGTTLWGRSGPVLTGLAVAVALTSIYSFHLVEDPVRRSAWLERRPRSGGLDRTSGRVSRPQQNGWFSLAVVLGLLVLVAMQRSVPERVLLADAEPGAGVGAGAAVSQPGSTTPTVDALQVELGQALRATAWPELTPSLDEAAGGAQAPDEILACGTQQQVDQVSCAWGPPDAEKTAVIVGDSVSMTYVTTLRSALGDWRLLSLGGFGCTFTDALIGNSVPELERNCPERKRTAVKTINELKPDLVLISNVQYPRVPAGAQEALTEAQWADSTNRLVDQFSSSAGKVVFLAPPPAEKDLSTCYTRTSTPEDCVGTVTPDWQARAATEQAMADRFGGAWVDSTPWFCVDGRCPAFAGTTPTKVDVVHMTPTYAQKIAPSVRESLAALDLL